MSQARYTKEQVLEAERASWAPAMTCDEAHYYYDGITFWHRPARGGYRATRPDEAPAGGWWHRDGCNCALCREAAGQETTSCADPLLAAPAHRPRDFIAG